MFTSNHLRRRLSISHAHGNLHARIAPQNEKSGPWSVLLFTVVLLFAAGYAFIPGCFRRAVSPVACVLIFLVPLISAGGIVFCGSLWALFGVEEIIVQDGTLRWTKTALFWKRRFEVFTANISKVEAISPWHGLNNRVEFTARGRPHTIGTKLLSSEARELASALNRALQLS